MQPFLDLVSRDRVSGQASRVCPRPYGQRLTKTVAFESQAVLEYYGRPASEVRKTAM